MNAERAVAAHKLFAKAFARVVEGDDGHAALFEQIADRDIETKAERGAVDGCL